MKRILSKIGLWYIDLGNNIKECFENITNNFMFMDECDIIKTILLISIGVFLVVIMLLFIPELIKAFQVIFNT